MHFDVAIAGLGGMGSAVAAHCAARGASTIGFEKFQRGNVFSSSNGRSRLIRKAYFEEPAYVPLLHRAYELWEQLQRDSEKKVFHRSGLLTLGPENSAIIKGTRRAAEEHRLSLQARTRADLQREYPFLRLRSDEVGLFEADAGVLEPEAAMAAQLQLAEKAGAVLRFEEAVDRWKAREDRVEVSTSAAAHVTSDTLILTTGPWLRDLLAQLGITLQVQRNVQAWFSPAHAGFEIGSFPSFLIERSEWPAPLYGFPDLGAGVKAAFHGFGRMVEPEDVCQQYDFEEDVAPLQRAMESWIPGAARTFLEAKPCRYSLSPDQHFIIDRLPAHPHVILCGGFSGHGFKFAPLIGEVAADLALKGETPHEIGFLSAKRFH